MVAVGRLTLCLPDLRPETCCTKQRYCVDIKLKGDDTVLFPTHIVGGALAGLCLTPKADLGTTLAAAVVGSLAALLPDIDSPHSFLGSKLPVLPSTVKLTMGHRGPLHSLAVAVIVYVSGFWLIPQFFTKWPPELPFWILGGYISHLFLDMLNPSGVPLLWPLPGRIMLPLVGTGGLLERTIIFPVLAGLLMFLLYKKIGGVYF